MTAGNEARLSRRQLAKLFVVGGSVALFARCGGTWQVRQAMPAAAPKKPKEPFWSSVRAQYVMPEDLAVMNAANLCPSPAPVLEATYAATKDVDSDPSYQNRGKLGEAKEKTRRLLADFLRVRPEEIVITRNTSEGNNLVANGLDLTAGDEVVIFSDNHPSNNRSWKERARRFGFTVREVEPVHPHPGDDYYVDAFSKQMNARTKVLALTHVTNTVGDALPVKELCRIARERGILTLVDGAQTFGVMDLDLDDIAPDFYTGSGHKWPCGPKETGLLYVRKDAQSRIWPSMYSAISGRVGISKTLESFGQRDDAAIVGFGEALEFQDRIGRANVEKRARDLAQALMAELAKIDGVHLWTHPDSRRSLSVVSFRPGNLDGRKLFAALYERDHIVSTSRGGERSGLRLSPHVYNLTAEVDRAVSAIHRYMKSGL